MGNESCRSDRDKDTEQFKDRPSSDTSNGNLKLKLCDTSSESPKRSSSGESPADLLLRLAHQLQEAESLADYEHSLKKVRSHSHAAAAGALCVCHHGAQLHHCPRTA